MIFLGVITLKFCGIFGTCYDIFWETLKLKEEVVVIEFLHIYTIALENGILSPDTVLRHHFLPLHKKMFNGKLLFSSLI